MKVALLDRRKAQKMDEMLDEMLDRSLDLVLVPMMEKLLDLPLEQIRIHHPTICKTTMDCK